MKTEPGGIYHIYNRGVDKRSIFNEDRDRWRFLQILGLFNSDKSEYDRLWGMEKRGEGANMKTLKEYLKDREDKSLVKVMADCLMNNHYHLILEEVTEGGISKFMQKIGTGYTMYFNKKYKRSGSLFQGNYKSIRVDKDLYLQYLLIYINLINPAEIIQSDLKEVGIRDIDKIMNFAADYYWSTHKEYLQERDSFIIEKGILGEVFSDPKRYKDFCRMVLKSEKYKSLDNFTLE
jgi:putative transposase